MAAWTPSSRTDDLVGQARARPPAARPLSVGARVEPAPTTSVEPELTEVGDVATSDSCTCSATPAPTRWRGRGRGAMVTGVDFSVGAIAEARRLATVTGVDATFVCADVLATAREARSVRRRRTRRWASVVAAGPRSWARVDPRPARRRRRLLPPRDPPDRPCACSTEDGTDARRRGLLQSEPIGVRDHGHVLRRRARLRRRVGDGARDGPHPRSDRDGTRRRRPPHRLAPRAPVHDVPPAPVDGLGRPSSASGPGPRRAPRFPVTFSLRASRSA